MSSSETIRSVLSSPFVSIGNRLQTGIDWVLLRAFGLIVRGETAGHLHLTLPSGRTGTLGTAYDGRDISITLNSYGVLWSLLTRGSNGFAENYMNGHVDCESLHDLFGFYLDNAQSLSATDYGVLGGYWRDRLFHRNRRNTRAGSRRNIAAHYDLGNEFYRLWLDPSMTYSSAIYSNPKLSLEAAQQEKFRRILDGLDMKAGQSVLEIGCGWGGFAEAAARRGANVTGITISQNQFDEGTARIANAGLADQITLKFEDYRDTMGTFDRIASIEMIEAVGEEHWATYFQVVADRLKSGGCAVIQAITIRSDLYALYRQNPDFIQRYVFPGGMLPTVEAMQRHCQDAGLAFETIETFASSYARTLAAWRQRFDEAWPRVEALGFDERFRRLWMYYLAYCEVGFERGTIDVGLYRFRKS